MVLTPIITTPVYKRFSPWHTHQISIFDWYHNFDTQGWFLPYHFVDADHWYHAFTDYTRPTLVKTILNGMHLSTYIPGLLCLLLYKFWQCLIWFCRRTQTHRKMIGFSCVGRWTAKNSHKTYALMRSRTSWCRFGWLCKQCSCNSCRHAPCSHRTSNLSPTRFKRTRYLPTVAGRYPTPRRPYAWALQANQAGYSTQSIRYRKTRSYRTSTSRPAGLTSCGATKPLFWWSEISSTATPCCRRRRLRLMRAPPRLITMRPRVGCEVWRPSSVRCDEFCLRAWAIRRRTFVVTVRARPKPRDRRPKM